MVSEKPNKSSSNVAAQTALSFKAQPISEQTGKDVKKTEVLKKSGTLDWSKAKAKATPTLPPQKEARSNQPIKEPKETYTGKEALKVALITFLALCPFFTHLNSSTHRLDQSGRVPALILRIILKSGMLNRKHLTSLKHQHPNQFYLPLLD